MKATKRKLIRDLKRKGIPFKLRVVLADRLRKGTLAVVDMYNSGGIDGVKVLRDVVVGKTGVLVRYTVYARDKAGKFVPVYTVDNFDD